jgi:D-tagatose-1,6-bisphosphate aldolase subunit GatZ/KbaZ
VNSYLDSIVAAHNAGNAVGITSICSANQFVIEAGLRHALTTDKLVLIESTCNQVNQFGGYTGMQPSDFAALVYGIADEINLPKQRVILGGDHLGPNPWKSKPASQAMKNAVALVHDCVLAGYNKIHLDASMKCADDPADASLEKTISALRAAEMAKVAEQTFMERGHGPAPRYVIGTEVPTPGGAQEQVTSIHVTTPEDVADTIEVTRDAFHSLGLMDAWKRVIAVVVQPGVEFGNNTLFEYNSTRAHALSQFIETFPEMVYEAHSTDYQRELTLRNMIEDHFAILKVGPVLTFSFREAVFALEMMESELLEGQTGVIASQLQRILDEEMLRNPAHWQGYYHGDTLQQRFARKYSFSDRARYYWSVPAVKQAISRLMDNLSHRPIPIPLISQYLPEQYKRVRSGKLCPSPRDFILDKIITVLESYERACGLKGKRSP